MAPMPSILTPAFTRACDVWVSRSGCSSSSVSGLGFACDFDCHFEFDLTINHTKHNPTITTQITLGVNNTRTAAACAFEYIDSHWSLVSEQHKDAETNVDVDLPEVLKLAQGRVVRVVLVHLGMVLRVVGLSTRQCLLSLAPVPQFAAPGVA